MATWVQIALAIFTAVGGIGGLVALAKVLPESRRIGAEAEKHEADAASVLSAAAVAILEPAQREVTRLAARLESAESRVRDLEAEVTSLTARLRTADRRVKSLSDRLTLAHQTFTRAGIPFPPIEGDDV